MDELQTAEISFQNGDNFFSEEHNQWTELEKQLMAEGYTYEEIKNLREYYKEQIAYVSGKERASVKELNLGKSIWKDMVSDDTEIIEEKDKTHEKTQDRIITKQPKR
jgi:phage regulator Rha-like protein